MKHFYKPFMIVLFTFTIVPVVVAQFTITGTIVDENSQEPLVGANIFHEASSTGATTNIDGEFTLRLPGQNATLRVTYIGYISKNVEVNANNSNVRITLRPDVANLDEVVVTGLASSVKRSNLANAVESVSSDRLTGTSESQTLDGALNGKIVGANIVQNSGAPGGGVSIKLRGITTINGASEPLYIVDGVYMNNSAISNGSNPVTNASTDGEVATSQDNPSNRIADLSPEDIQSVEILKGASASAIYGARANAGVVIITTKKGQRGETQINYSQAVGFSSIVNPVGIRDFTEERVRNTFNEAEAAEFVQAQNNGNLFDYEEEVYGEEGFITDSRLSISGGNDQTRFFISGSLKDEEGIVKNTGFDRKSVRLNLDHRISNFVDVSLNTNYVNSGDNRSVTNNDNAGVSIGVALTSTRPWKNLFADENGNFPNNPNAGSNPLQTIALSTVAGTTNRFTGGGEVNFNFLQNSASALQLKLRGGLDYFTNETLLHFPAELQFQQAGATATNGFFSRGNNTVLNLNLSALLLYTFQVNDIAFTSQAGITRLEFDQDRETTQATELVGGQTNLEQAGALNVFNRVLEQEDMGYFLQQEANWDDKIIGTVGLRLDQSSLIGDPDEVYAFPKGSVAFNLTGFDFWNFDLFNQFKVRAAYGEAGGVPNPDNVTLQQPKFTVLGIGNVDGNTGSTILEDATLGNPDIKPERSKEFETGFDLAVFNNLVSLSATYYNKTVEDLILEAAQPQSSGFTTQILNAGELKNEGVELSLSASPVNGRNLKWTSTTNFWLNRAEITRLDIPAFIDNSASFSTTLGAFKIEEGQSPTQIVGRTPESPGTDVKLGDAEPDFQMSFFNTVNFLQGFEFSMLWHWKQGGENVNLTNLLSDFGGTTFDYDDDSDGDGVTNSAERINAFFSGTNTVVFIEDSGYLKLREIGLYYTLPRSVTNNIYSGIDRVKFGVSGHNMLIITDYSGYDPEVSNFGNNGISTGIDVAPFPSSRRMMFHFSIGF